MFFLASTLSSSGVNCCGPWMIYSLEAQLLQPVPELNLASVAKRGEAHPRQEKVPGSFTKLSSEVFGASVPSLRRTENCVYVQYHGS